MSGHYISYADWSGAEYAAALRCLLSGKVSDGENAAQLAKCFARRYFPSSAYLMNYGHTGIQIALAAFNRRMPDRTEVLVPAYICPSVVDTIVAAGLTAVPVDIGDDLNLTPATVAEALTGRTLAVVAPHMFGCPARIAEIESLCRDAKVFLLDDAAQVVGIQQEGRLLGTFGDMGIISFAQSKAVVTGIRGSGGVLLVNNPDFDEETSIAWKQLPPPSARMGAFLHFLWNYVWEAHTGNSGYNLGRIGDLLGLRCNASTSGARISNLEAGIALIQLERLAKMQEAKIHVAERYHRKLRGNQAIGFPQYASGRYLSRIMLSLPRGVNLPAVRTFLRDRRVRTRLGYAVPFPSENATRNAEAWSGRLLGVPCGAGIGEIAVREICGALSEALDSASLNWKSK